MVVRVSASRTTRAKPPATGSGPPGAGTGGNIESVFNVKDYGALGNSDSTGVGGADDTAAIAATVNAVLAAGGGTIYFPKGAYKITSTINFNGNANF